MEKPSVLIVGGSGFMGYHIVHHFVHHPDFGSVTVLSRSAGSSQSKNHVEGASYVSANLNDAKSIRSVLSEIKPTVIIHAASPSPVTGTPREYKEITVDGTNNLLDLARESKHVRVLIYTSSSTMAKGREHVDLDETYPLADTDPKAPVYAQTKASAEIAVLKANKPLPINSTKEGDWTGYLSTGSLRFPIVYGTHDLTSIPGCLGALEQGQTNVQIGDGKNLWDFCSTENAAIAHSILTQALLGTRETTAKVDGEAFHIHDGAPRPFWDFARAVWKAAGHKPKTNSPPTSIPIWFALGLANALELLFWIFTFGTKRPQTLGKQQVEYACFTHTYNIEKARTRLGYVPKLNFEKDVEDAVNWSLENDGWSERLKKVGI